MDQQSKTEFGTIKIHKNVIASIANNTIKEIPGALRIAHDFKSKITQLITKSSSAPAVKIEFDKNNEAIINIPLVVLHGYNIPEVAAHVQESVKSAIESTTNIVIKEINVNVKQIENREERKP